MKRDQLIMVAAVLVVMSAAGRFFPHLPNMTPLTATAFIGGRYLQRLWSILLPLAGLFLSDLLIGFYDWRLMLTVYASVLLIGWIGRVAWQYRATVPVSVSVVSSSSLFFLITNGAVWAFAPWYAKTWAGLMTAYTLGLPFFRNMLIGDIAYTALGIAIIEGVLLMRQPRSRMALTRALKAALLNIS